MHWLYNAFSSQPSAAVDNRINNRTTTCKCHAVNKFSARRIIRSHYHNRRYGSSGSTTNKEHIDVVEAPSTRHVLPLPELSALFKHESRREAKDRSMYHKHMLPSPEDESFENKRNLHSSHKNPSRLPCIRSLDSTRNREYKQSHKWPQGSSFTEDGQRQNAGTASAPTNKSNMYTYNDNLSLESSKNQRDSNAQATMATVHPLPLPPGLQRPDLVPKKPRQISRWQKGKLIGRGTFGTVYVGSHRETGALCAMKEVEILPDDAKSAESIKQLQQEIDVLRKLKHPNIVQYYGSEIVENRFYIYLEYVHPGSINKYVRDHCEGGMTESIVRNFTRHIVSGLAYLHRTKTIHRDIKGANLLVDANGVVKLADFGMAKNLDGQVNLSLKGSPYWLAPELLNVDPKKDGFPLAVDIWSLGCTVIEMINGKPPWNEYEGAAAMFKVMKETPPIPEAMSSDGKDFLRCCFVRNPAERPTANMLLEHNFLMVQNPRQPSR